jgi:hypothetical protein
MERRDSNLKRELPVHRKTPRVFEHVALYSGVPITGRCGIGSNISLECGGGAL